MAQSQKLDISSLQKALTQLEQSLVYYHSDLVQQDPGLVLQLQAAAIQAFEFTYELAWKMLKRYLEIAAAHTGDIDAMSFPDLIRTGSEQKLVLHGWDIWKTYRAARNITSHTYNQSKAKQVLEIIPSFIQEVKYLSQELISRIPSL